MYIAIETLQKLEEHSVQRIPLPMPNSPLRNKMTNDHLATELIKNTSAESRQTSCATAQTKAYKRFQQTQGCNEKKQFILVGLTENGN